MRRPVEEDVGEPDIREGFATLPGPCSDLGLLGGREHPDTTAGHRACKAFRADDVHGAGDRAD
jgi:hypothetical protein